MVELEVVVDVLVLVETETVVLLLIEVLVEILVVVELLVLVVWRKIGKSRIRGNRPRPRNESIGTVLITLLSPLPL